MYMKKAVAVAFGILLLFCDNLEAKNSILSEEYEYELLPYSTIEFIRCRGHVDYRYEETALKK